MYAVTQNIAEAAAGLQPTVVHTHASSLKIVHLCYLPVCSKHGHMLMRGFSMTGLSRNMFSGPREWVRVKVRSHCDVRHESWSQRTKVTGLPMVKTT